MLCQEEEKKKNSLLFGAISRVSKSCNQSITRLRKIFENLLKFWTNERKTGNSGTNFMYLAQVDKVFQVSHVFM